MIRDLALNLSTTPDPRTGDSPVGKNFFDGNMDPHDRQANREATFYPAREPYAPLITCPAATNEDGSTDETYGPPCVTIGGVQVYTYVRDGILVISLHYDTADLDAFATYDGTCIPTVIHGGGGEIVWEALPDDAVSETDARQLRKTEEDRPGDWVLPDWVYGE